MDVSIESGGETLRVLEIQPASTKAELKLIFLFYLILKDLFVFVLYVCVLPHVCMCTSCIPGVHGDQMRVLDPLALEFMYGCDSLCGCWEPNHSPLQVLFAMEPFFSSHIFFYLLITTPD